MNNSIKFGRNKVSVGVSKYFICYFLSFKFNSTMQLLVDLSVVNNFAVKSSRIHNIIPYTFWFGSTWQFLLKSSISSWLTGKLSLNFKGNLLRRCEILIFMYPPTTALRQKCQNTEFFWSVFSCIWTKYEDLLHKSPCSVRTQENMDQKNLCIWTFFRIILIIIMIYGPFTDWNHGRCNWSLEF